jgi:hypothetical protein
VPPDARCGPASTALDVVREIETTARVKGVWPLVVASENGAPYDGRTRATLLTALRILPLNNEPRTPQQNAWSE